MKYLSYFLICVMMFLLVGCNNNRSEEGTDPGKDTESIVLRNEDSYYEAINENPLSPESVAKREAEREANLKKLKITDEKVGEGKEVEEGSKVLVHYTGKLENGKVFDTSLKGKKEPFEVVVGEGRVIQGWDLGLLGMKAGGKRHLVIPPELGYGDMEAGPIPANSTLIFDIELLEVK